MDRPNERKRCQSCMIPVHGEDVRHAIVGITDRGPEIHPLYIVRLFCPNCAELYYRMAAQHV